MEKYPGTRYHLCGNDQCASAIWGSLKNFPVGDINEEPVCLVFDSSITQKIWATKL